MVIDYELLTKQRNFLLGYPWRDAKFPEEVDGIINLLDAILDEVHDLTNDSEELACTSDDPTNHQGDTCPIHEA